MPGALFIEGEKVNLRTVEKEDVEFLRDSYNHPEVRKGVHNLRPANMKQEKEFFENVVSSDDSVHLLVTVDEEPVGMVSVEDREDPGVGEIGIMLHPDHHGNGYGTESSELLLGHVLGTLGYRKILARVNQENPASARIWEKLGFTHEGTLRDQIMQDGETLDVELYGILREEW